MIVNKEVPTKGWFNKGIFFFYIMSLFKSSFTAKKLIQCRPYQMADTIGFIQRGLCQKMTSCFYIFDRPLHLVVVHKWSHAILNNFWPSTAYRHAFYYYGLSTVVTTPYPLRPLRHLWTTPYALLLWYETNYLISKNKISPFTWECEI